MNWLRSTSTSRSRGLKRQEPVVTIAATDACPLYLRLNNQGEVTACSEALQQLLPVEKAEGKRPLRDYLMRPVLWLRETPGSWPAQLPTLGFQGRGGCELYLSGWLRRERDGWLVQLLNVTETMVRLQGLENKSQLLGQAWRLASALRASHREYGNLVADWLEYLALRLHIPWVMLVSRNEVGGWSTEQIFRRPGHAVRPMMEADIREMIERYGEDVAGQWYDPAGGPPVWLVPYREDNRILAWLCCGGYEAAEQTPWLDRDDWLHLFAMLAAQVIKNKNEVARALTAQRSAALEWISGGGWWEYLPRRRSFRFAPNLAAVLELPAGQETLPLDEWTALVDPLERDEFRHRLDEAVASGRAFVQILRLRIGGVPRWYRVEARPVVRDKECYLLGFVLDINTTRQQETEAAAVKARLEGLVDSAPGIIYVQRYDAGALAMTFASASLGTMLGWTLDDMLASPYTTYLHPDDCEIYFARTRTLLRNGSASCQYRIRDAAGDYHWIQDEAKLLRDDRGLPSEVVGLCLDITEAKESGERVVHSEERYRALVEDSPAIICRYLPNLRVTYANNMLASSLGIAPDHAADLDLGDYLSREQRAKMIEELHRLTPEQPVNSMEICVQLPAHHYGWWVVYQRGLFDLQGRLVEVQAVARDDSEVHRTRHQLFQSAKMATLGEMAAGLAHEINQPLNVISMAATNLLTQVDNDTLTPTYLKAKVERIVSQVSRAAGIVDHVRMFGRYSDIEGSRFNPGNAVTGSLWLTRESLERHGIVISVDTPELPEVVGHIDRLEQVLINLIINARYAVLGRKDEAPDLVPRIAISSAVHDGRIRISVDDNGGGIDPAIIERIFEPFFTTKPVGDGTGLGLSLSYAIIQQMAGEMWAENIAEGASFILELPVW